MCIEEDVFNPLPPPIYGNRESLVRQRIVIHNQYRFVTEMQCKAHIMSEHDHPIIIHNLAFQTLGKMKKHPGEGCIKGVKANLNIIVL